MKEDEILKRVDTLIEQGNQTILTSNDAYTVNHSDYVGFLAASISFVGKIYGTNHTYYQLFKANVRTSYISSIQGGINILKAIKGEIEQGWLKELRELINAEVFTDFLEMSEHLLEENYKDAAAVIIGSVLEEHLRQLCAAHSVDAHQMKGSDNIPKKASQLNDDLRKASVYQLIDNKQISTWLGIRNSAAHGHYGDYHAEQVRLMLQGVMNFVSRVR